MNTCIHSWIGLKSSKQAVACIHDITWFVLLPWNEHFVLTFVSVKTIAFFKNILMTNNHISQFFPGIFNSKDFSMES